MSTSVHLYNLSRRYGDTVHALRDVTLSVKPGEFVTLLGPSGSGKSTILKLIAGFDQPTAGDILIDGRSVLNIPSYRRGIGMVFQNYALFPHLTVTENIAFPLRVRACAEAEVARRVDHGLDITRLGDFRDRFPSELSGGQQQRVALARAIVFDPKVLLMDEPLGALDRHLREQLKFEIKRIQQDLKMTVLFVTHDQDEALVLSDRIVVMRDGRLEQEAAPFELYARPCNRFVANFVGDANILPCSPAARAKLNGHATSPTRGAAADWIMVRPEHVELYPEASPDTMQGLLRDQIFLGDTIRYIVEIDRQMITAKRPAKDRLPVQAGEVVHVGWRWEDAVPLQD